MEVGFRAVPLAVRVESESMVAGAGERRNDLFGIGRWTRAMDGDERCREGCD